MMLRRISSCESLRRRRLAPGRSFLSSEQQIRDFHVPLPWDKRREAREKAELDCITKAEGVMKALDGSLVLPPDSSFYKWLEHNSKDVEGAVPKKEEFQKWLSAAESELNTQTKAQIGIFSGGEWWRAGHDDHLQAIRSLHSLQLQHLCAELKKSKAVFTPHISGDYLGKGTMAKVVAVLQAHLDGDLETRLKAAWMLQDDSTESKGWLSEQGMEDAVHTVLNPVIATAATLYPSLPGVNKAQKKAFVKFIKSYTRDHTDLPSKLRCVFHWTEPPQESLPTKPPPVPVPKVIDLPGYLKTQEENFPDMHQVGKGSMELYKRVREAYYHQKKEDRDTFRTGVVYLIALGFADVYVSGL
ncbi:hypothetical protein NSK_006731 [Nannochloropsis salina CCMP1776]|uniref:Uncharacterized protein n=1 Tax=Nannochloropsis salina CCMP1776 TaxID=1027361 RepID=A0A4D9CX82_9STRA|nr:hypothetical protein NSK_006731 [Nannochloropsis salina CCMP1776]|eukprot:TFJ82065.1 hypothetical protein NSK_006731 [Nannochloropsis salina CCMP1776]